MAIILEEEKKSTGFLGLAAWILIIAAVGFAIYYLFVKRPELVPVPTPAGLKNSAELTKLAPEDILQNPVFQQLKAYASDTLPGNIGRSNPFLGF